MDISPKDFVNLTLPVYKAMFEHMPKTAMWKTMKSGMPGMPVNQALRFTTMTKHYTSVSFGRLLALAGRQLRLNADHFEAARDAVIDNSGLILAPNLQQEQARSQHVSRRPQPTTNKNAARGLPVSGVTAIGWADSLV